MDLRNKPTPIQILDQLAYLTRGCQQCNPFGYWTNCTILYDFILSLFDSKLLEGAQEPREQAREGYFPNPIKEGENV